MSVAIVAIGAAHALPILITAGLSRNKSSTLVATAIMVISALVTGAFKFFGIDLVFILTGCWIGMKMCKKY